jgi:hypothetical protein
MPRCTIGSNKSRLVRRSWQFGFLTNIFFICTQSICYYLTAKIFFVSYENNERKQESIYSKRIRAGKRRTYFFDVRSTKGNDYYLTITESRKRFDDNGYDRHKIFLYKEDFNKFVKALGEAVEYVKTDLMPDFDFDAFNHDENIEEEVGHRFTNSISDKPLSSSSQPKDDNLNDFAGQPGGEVDKW